MLNQLLGGHYRVVQDLQEGGLAKTYIAEDHHRPGHPKCAVKFLKPASNQADFLPIARRLFKQEAEILEQLGQHPQIPRLLAYFEENEQFYLVQEFIEGHTLSTELPRGHRWSESKVIQMLEDVLQTLEFVHRSGVIHRDIKPNNLIRRQQDGQLVLIDFGAVKQVRAPLLEENYSSIIQRTISIGTQGYMPTEQVRGKPRLSSDIYALGMIGIQALTGVHPLDLPEDEEGEIRWQDLAQVSEKLAIVLTKMVRYHFKDRYQSAIKARQAIQSLIPDYSIANNSVRENFLVATKSKLTEQQVALSINYSSPENSAAIKEIDTGLAKTELDLEQLSFEGTTETEIQKTKSRFKITSALSNLKQRKQGKMRNTEINNGRLLKRVLSNYLSINSAVSSLKKFHNACPQLQFPQSRLLIGTGITSILCGVLTGYSYLNNSHVRAQQDFEQIENLKATAEYQECLQKARKFPQTHAYLHSEVLGLLAQCYQAQAAEQLKKAKELAEQSQLRDAIALANQIPEDATVDPEAQQLKAQWSQQIFQIANNKYLEGNFQEAIAIAEAIPSDSSLSSQVQSKIEQWDQEWQQNQNYLQTAQKKLNERHWEDAIDNAHKISSTTYWQQQSEPIIRQAKAEISAAQTPTPKKTVKTSSNSNSNSNSSSSSTAPSYRPFPRTLSHSLRSKPVKSSGSMERPNSNPRYTSKMTCKNKLHPKCPR